MRKPAEKIFRRSKRRSNPALYELIQARSASRAVPTVADPEPATPSSQPQTGGSTNWLSPGRTIRVPIGYLFLAAAALILLVVFVYMFGFQHGERSTQLQFGDLADGTAPARNAAIAQDPMARDTGPGAGSAQLAAAAVRSNTAWAVTNRDLWGPPQSDPREAGLNYFVLIHTRRANAVTLADFCRAESLEAYVVKAKNMDQYQVIVLPGYRRGDREHQQIIALERTIKQVTRKWKLRRNSRDDLSYYPVRYNG